MYGNYQKLPSANVAQVNMLSQTYHCYNWAIRVEIFPRAKFLRGQSFNRSCNSLYEILKIKFRSCVYKGRLLFQYLAGPYGLCV